MDVDEDEQNPLFRTPSPLLHDNTVAKNELSTLKSLSTIFDKEDDMIMPTPFDFKRKKEKLLDFKRADVQNQQDIDFLPPVLIREVQKSARDEAKKTDWTLIDNEFNAHQEQLIEFSSNKPCFGGYRLLYLNNCV